MQDVVEETPRFKSRREVLPKRQFVQPTSKEKRLLPPQNQTASKRRGKPLQVPQIDDEEMRREERIEARRLRRRAERQAEREARRDRRRGDDLLRIREIFEGSRRP